MVDSHDITVAKQALGVQLARLREAAGLKQAELAARILTSRSTVANVETGHSSGTSDFWTRADQVLQAGGDLTNGYEQLGVLVRRQREQAARAASTARSRARSGRPSSCRSSLVRRGVHRTGGTRGGRGR